MIGCQVVCKHIYLCYVDQYIGALNPHTGEIRYATSDKFVKFVQKILEDFPDYSPHNVINYGIQNEIRKKIKADLAAKVFEKNLKNL